MYIDALKSSGYKEIFTYKEEVPNSNNNNEINKENKHKNRKREIIWFPGWEFRLETRIKKPTKTNVSGKTEEKR